MKNNTLYLTKQRFNTLFFHTGRIITFIVLTAAFCAVNLISMIWMNTDNEQMLSNILIICASAVAGLLFVILTLSVFRGEVTNNQVNLELRQGYKPRQIFIARVVEIVFDLAVFMVIAIIVNLATIGAKGKMDSVMWYHMFVTSLGWYVLIAIVSIAMTVFFCSFLNSGWAGTIATLIMLIVIVIGGVINGVVGAMGPSHDAFDDYSSSLISDDIDSNVLDFAMNNLGIHSKDQWDKEVVKQFVDLPQNDEDKNKGNGDIFPPTNNNGDNDNGKNSNGDIAFSNIDKSKLNPDTYYAMITGDWSEFSDEQNYLPSGSSDRDGDDAQQIVDNAKDNPFRRIYRNFYFDKYDYDYSTVIASFMALGNNVLVNKFSDNNPLTKFFNMSHSFFTNNVKDIKFNDLDGGGALSGDPTRNFKESTAPVWYTDKVDKNGNEIWHSKEKEAREIVYSPDTDTNKISHENFFGVMNKISDSKLGNEYPFLKRIANVSDAEVLSAMYNSQEDVSDNGLWGDNVELNRKLYPNAFVGGNALKKDNVASQISKFMSPAELMFNRNIMFLVNKAFNDMNDRVTTVPDQTQISDVMFSGNKVYLRVENTEQFRKDDGSISYATSLKPGKLSSKYDGMLKIDAEEKNNNSGWNMDSLGTMNITNLKYETGVEFDFQYSNGRGSSASGTDYMDNAIVGEISNPVDPMRYAVTLLSTSKNFLIEGDNGSKNDNRVGDNGVIGSNPWKDNLPKSTLSFIKYSAATSNSKATVDFKFWNKVNDPNSGASENTLSDNTHIYADGKNIDSTVDWNNLVADEDGYGYTLTFNEHPNGKLSFSFENDYQSGINDVLVDGSLFKPSFDYKDSETHKSAISWIYNPMTQLSSMFNGVNYRNPVLDNLLNSYVNSTFVGVNTLNVEVTSESADDNAFNNIISMHRSTKVEVVYIYYALLESLFVFSAFWIYRKKIVS